MISLEYHETLMVAAGSEARELLHDATDSPGSILAVEGSLSHRDGWCTIAGENSIEDLERSATTWNASSRDAQDQGGPMEMALLDHRVHDKAHPIELLRTIHTFDPCIACAVHLSDAAGTEQLDIRLQGTEHNPG